MTPLEIMDALTQIPHLQLDIPVDVDALLAETSKVGDEYVSFETSPTVRDNRLNLDVYGVMDYQSDPKFAGESDFRLKTDHMKHTKTMMTDLGIHMPYTTGLIYDIGEKPERCRLSRLKGKHNVPWHDHMQRQRPGKSYNHFVIHIPIITNKNVEFSVRDLNGVEHRQHYATGTVWLLNTWLEHAVFNASSEDRIHLWLNYFMLDQNKVINPNLLKLLEKSLNGTDRQTKPPM